MSKAKQNSNEETGSIDKEIIAEELEEYGSVSHTIPKDGEELVWIFGESELVYSRVLDHIRDRGWQVKNISILGESPYFWIVPEE